jgi:putative DNA primase/helicase
LGDYAMKTPTETFLLRRDGAIPNDIARLKGARFVWASETEDGKHLAEAKLKDMTGNERITARFMRGEWFDFQPEFTPWMGTNHKPEIRGKDDAIWDRLILVPFNVRIPEGEQDKDLPQKLRAELPGILRWIVEGCLAWQGEGLNVPEEVTQATEEYRSEMDPYSQFIIECLAFEPGGFCSNPDLRYQYSIWAYQVGESVPREDAEITRGIGSALKRYGCESHTKRGSGKPVQRGWVGVTFKEGWGPQPVVTKVVGISDVDSDLAF